jgi:hypothetical protein
MNKIICCVCGKKVKGGGIVIAEQTYHIGCFQKSPLGKKIKNEMMMFEAIASAELS